MRRTVLPTLGILLLAIGARLALPSHAAAASSGKIIYSFAGGARRTGSLPPGIE